MDREISALEFSLGAMFGVYMSKQGEDGKLSKQAFLELLDEELPSFKGQGKNAGEEVFKDIDMNQDGSVDFKEFALMIAGYACGSYDTLQKVMKEAQKKK
ncbi:protein S100-G [Fundulus heteroclitus]|uniref:protein S100-G n=1 Tax=Fundulus heteroclitus TaxID=8078 RepID=UPI00165B89CD|nr:protein S100-G [Fundulus heteroclitus]